ncbi:cytochrome c oxidase accessory protein CcoG [Novimethylophilus kurashikiensis]|uniref:Cytochrome c oxidase accessory protein CcoG n=1 Tax=Novimethylophilus kurashikiensis TaxID=1825523 RepID=A0A2R5F3Q8_9PROT|nr:cytochrome c oxidase accessory protein CcoG [Novimethylophilus kurashikiensis]GBG13092.1 cytochrome c oxidase accessory protein CcoG [Novimethylophilus kurashikiensis]
MTNTTVEDDNEPLLYQKRIPIYTRTVKGRFRNFKTGILLLAYSIYFLLPWIPWQRHSGSHQAILFDLVSRRFFIFDIVVYPQDIFMLSLLLFIAATFLFFATGLVGRAWCGYFCFQTLWTDAFMLIEHIIQGERPARMKLAKQPWNIEKILKVGGARFLMLLLSFWTGFTFVAYFNHTPEFLFRFFSGDSVSTAYFSVAALTVSTFIAGALAREQVCIYMCPYARFQSVMYETDTLVPSYNAKRGEGSAGRLAPKAGAKTLEERHEKGHGDCVDCGFCVQVCPTGVDIRKGLQYQCISCGLCIDACNTIMDSLGWERGLIRYDSEGNLNQEKPGKPHLNFMRLKVLGYLGALGLMVGMLVYIYTSRTDYEVRIFQVRQPLYVKLSDETVRNRYDVHIVNKTQKDESYLIKADGVPESAIKIDTVTNPVTVVAGKDVRFPVKVDLNEDLAEHTKGFRFVIVPVSEPDKKAERSVSFDSEKEHH